MSKAEKLIERYLGRPVVEAGNPWIIKHSIKLSSAGTPYTFIPGDRWTLDHSYPSGSRTMYKIHLLGQNGQYVISLRDDQYYDLLSASAQ